MESHLDSASPSNARRYKQESPLQVGFLSEQLPHGSKGTTVASMENDTKSKKTFPLPGLGLLSKMNPGKNSGVYRGLMRCARIISLLIQDFLDHRCLLWASALSFATILSIVPFLALAFAVLKGLGVHNILEPFILERLTAGSQEVADRIITYINNTKMGSVGAIGLVALIITVISLLGNVEEAFNAIWGVKETRSFGRKFSDYVSVVVSAPILFLAATSISTTLQSQSLVSWLTKTRYIGDFVLSLFQLVPYLSICAALIFLYIFIPNTKVRIGSALLGGILAGVIWQMAQWGYIHFQVGVSKYNAIYGTLSALPVFMVWMYTSWIIILFGVEIVCAHQNRSTYLNESHCTSLNYAEREIISLVLIVASARSYYRDEAPWTCDRYVAETGLPAKVVKELLAQLVEQKYLAATGGDDPAYIPVRAPEHMYISEIMEDLKNYGESCELSGMNEIRDVLKNVLTQFRPCADVVGAGFTVKDLVERLSDEESVR
jgi:membrane protein